MTAAELADVVGEAIAVATAPLLERIQELEIAKAAMPQRGDKGDPGERGADGKDADPLVLEALRGEVTALRSELAVVKSTEPAWPSFLVDESGDLVAVLGKELKRLGRVRGRDGTDGQGVDVDAVVTKVAALIPAPKNGQDGASVDPAAVEAMVGSAVEKRMAQIELPKDGQNGKDADPEFVRAEVAKAVAALPKPADGKDVDLTTVQLLVDASVTKAVNAIPKPQDGKSVDMADVETLVEKAVSRLPPAKNGTDGVSVTVDDVKPLVSELVTKAVQDIRVPAPVGVVGALTNREGNLILTLSDGSTRDAGSVIGRDGTSVDMEAVTKAIKDEIAKIPTPKDGKDGRDGKDGASFEDFEFVFDDVKKSCFWTLKGAGAVNAQRVPFPMHVGIYDSGETYYKGHLVTQNGSTFMALKDGIKGITPDAESPTGSRAWRMIVQRGKEGKRGPEGPPGPKGDDLNVDLHRG